MAKYTEDTKKNTDLHQQMPAQNPTPEVDRQGIQHYTLEMDQATTHRKLNKEEKMEVDRTHTQETSRNHHPSCHQMEPSQGRGEEVGPGTPGKETQKGKQKRWVTPGERWRGWP